jgi:8-oxo-dGTP pyrophosphatase MutT (NUDIX family)
MPPVVPVPSSTVLLIRDSANGIEVLMTARHEAAGFAGGALVFPGGKLSPEDSAIADGGAADLLHPYRVAAIRETWEECGILLARRRGAAALISGDELRDVPPHENFNAMVEAAGLQLAGDLLVPFAHWITPQTQPKRFDTQFFLAPAPPGQDARHDGHEAVDANWVTPEQAVRDAEADRVRIVFVTRLNLLKLGQSRSVAEALDRARRDKIVTVQPEIVQTPEGALFRIPPEAGYPISQTIVKPNARA